MTSSDALSRIDRHVGQRVKMRRKFMKLSQKTLAEAVGVSYQQIQKYEKGDNRISCSALWGIAEVLGVPIGFFFEGIAAPARAVGAPADGGADPMSKHDVIRMAREFDRIGNERVRRGFVDLARSFADFQDR